MNSRRSILEDYADVASPYVRLRTVAVTDWKTLGVPQAEETTAK